MTTKRALSHLETAITIVDRAERQILALAETLDQAIREIEAIVDDEDYPVEDVLVESATGNETKFILSRAEVKAGSVSVLVDGTAIISTAFTVSGNVITPNTTIPADSRIIARYTVLGLKSQISAILPRLSDLSAADFTAAIQRFRVARDWIRTNYGT